MNVSILLISQNLGANNSLGYTIGAIISLFILGYLLYSLFKPENF